MVYFMVCIVIRGVEIKLYLGGEFVINIICVEGFVFVVVEVLY